jgi:hypothetical protein
VAPLRLTATADRCGDRDRLVEISKAAAFTRRLQRRR